MTSKYFYLIVSILVICSCNGKSHEIYSELDGVDHSKIFEGPQNTKKYILSLIYQKDTTIKVQFLDTILTKLVDNKKPWRSLSFQALGHYANRLSLENEEKLKSSLFDYFLHYPKEYMFEISQMNLEKSDYFLAIFSAYVQDYTYENSITIISMKNVAYKNCVNCSDKDILKLYNYLELSSHFSN
jgi:hypothetical protein